MDFLPTSEAGLSAYIANRLEPRRANPDWQAAYNDAYARAETVWPTVHAHFERDIYAHLAADLHMAAAQSQPQPAALAPQPAKPSVPKRPAHHNKPRKTYSQVHAEQVRETQETMKRIKNMPVLATPRRAQAETEADAHSVGFGPSTAPNASGWARAFARHSDAR
ncbi:hypothetical protein G6L34_02015 [Agrobacterium tumefaciens]|uniref:hypothetical protein n=1 Tax=Agrobacterium tumefaciens TaxID=358 RepID=UPI0015719307|nr:hypothetical protein [Agrobacterium tumefaciens]NTA46868.1 hypothetical protein [Agrobacterium tumefaciens]